MKPPNWLENLPIQFYYLLIFKILPYIFFYVTKQEFKTQDSISYQLWIKYKSCFFIIVREHKQIYFDDLKKMVNR